MSQSTTEELSAAVVPAAAPVPTMAEVAEAIRVMASQGAEYLKESVVPFGGE